LCEQGEEGAEGEDLTPELIVGRISGVYGIKGWVKIHSFTEPNDNLFGYRDWKIRRGDSWQDIEFDSGREHGKGLIAHIVGIDDRNAAELLKGCDIAVPRAQLPALEQGEYYWHQLEGLAVYSAGQCLGRVDHLLETGANDVLMVKPCEGSIDSRERLIPWVQGQYVKQVDLEAETIEVDWDPEF
jgi:16S rRNA processing protein RimM